jgi:hypothetical protein
MGQQLTIIEVLFSQIWSFSYYLLLNASNDFISFLSYFLHFVHQNTPKIHRKSLISIKRIGKRCKSVQILPRQTLHTIYSLFQIKVFETSLEVLKFGHLVTTYY